MFNLECDATHQMHGESTSSKAKEARFIRDRKKYIVVSTRYWTE